MTASSGVDCSILRHPVNGLTVLHCMVMPLGEHYISRKRSGPEDQALRLSQRPCVM
jgi:hypothetical protein